MLSNVPTIWPGKIDAPSCCISEIRAGNDKSGKDASAVEKPASTLDIPHDLASGH